MIRLKVYSISYDQVVCPLSGEKVDYHERCRSCAHGFGQTYDEANKVLVALCASDRSGATKGKKGESIKEEESVEHHPES